MKIKQKTIEVPIYHGYLTIIYGGTLSEISKKFDLDGEFMQFGVDNITSYGAAVFDRIDEDGRRFYYMLLPEDVDNGIIAHEALHVANNILKHAHVEPSFSNDEPQAYLLG